MKRLFPVLLTFSLLLSPVSILEAQAAGSIKVLIDGNQPSYDQPPVNLNGTTMLPFRSIFETLGAEVTWDGATKTVTAKKRNVTITLRLDSKTAYKNGKAVELPQAAQLMNGRTMVPLRFVGEALGAQIEWDGATSTVNVISSEELLVGAIVEGDAEKVKQLLIEAGADPNLQDEFGATALHVALREKNLNAAAWLLELGADPNIASSIGETPLSHAIIFNRDPEALHMLTKAGVDVTDTEKHGIALLNTAISYNNTPMLKALLAAGVDPNRYPDRPPLVQAAFKGDVEGVKALLDAKANIFSTTADGHTAMMVALAANRQDVVALLRQAGDTTSTLPSDLPRFDEQAEIKRLQGLFDRAVIYGMGEDDLDLDPTESVMFLEIPYEDDREAFFNLSEQAQKEVILGYFKEYYKDHSDELYGATTCYTYITWDGESIAGAELTYDMETEDVELVVGARVPMK